MLLLLTLRLSRTVKLGEGKCVNKKYVIRTIVNTVHIRDPTLSWGRKKVEMIAKEAHEVYLNR